MQARRQDTWLLDPASGILASGHTLQPLQPPILLQLTARPRRRTRTTSRRENHFRNSTIKLKDQGTSPGSRCLGDEAPRLVELLVLYKQPQDW